VKNEIRNLFLLLEMFPFISKDILWNHILEKAQFQQNWRFWQFNICFVGIACDIELASKIEILSPLGLIFSGFFVFFRCLFVFLYVFLSFRLFFSFFLVYRKIYWLLHVYFDVFHRELCPMNLHCMILCFVLFFWLSVVFQPRWSWD